MQSVDFCNSENEVFTWKPGGIARSLKFVGLPCKSGNFEFNEYLLLFRRFSLVGSSGRPLTPNAPLSVILGFNPSYTLRSEFLRLCAYPRMKFESRNIGRWLCVITSEISTG